jgi:multiple sugar transport system permease protein
VRRRETLTAFLFLAPAFLIIGIFGLLPIVHAAYLSFFRWSLKPGPFLGLGNYEELFGGWENLAAVTGFAAVMVFVFRWAKPERRAVVRRTAWAVLTVLSIGLFLFLGRVWEDGDPDMLRSLQVTFWFALGTVPTQMVLGLLLALALDAKFQGKKWFRILFLVPYVVPVVASAGVFDLLFSLRPESMANQFLHFWGLGPSQWLREPRGLFNNGIAGSTSWLSSWSNGPSLALVCILLFNNWIFSGYYALIFSNGLASIPKEIYEAAKLDGVTKRALLFRIILPLLSPTSYFLALLGVIGTFKAFTSVYILRDPAVGGVTDPTSVYIFFTFFRELRYGYAAALAIVLFLIVVALTLIQRRTLEKRVFYG